MTAWALLSASLAAAAPGAEVVIVLDNRLEVERGPAGRGAELGAEMLLSLARGTPDRVTVIGLAEDERHPPRILSQANRLDALAPVSQGHAGPALAAARAALETSSRDTRLLVLVSAGPLAGGLGPEEARRALSLAPEVRTAWIAVGPDSAAEALASTSWDLHRVPEGPDTPERLAMALVAAYGQAMGGLPWSVDLEGGAAPALDEGLPSPPLTELVVVAPATRRALSVRREGAEVVRPRAQADGGCSAEVRALVPDACARPTTLAGIRVAIGPLDPPLSRWSVRGAGGEATFLARPALGLRLDLPDEPQAGRGEAVWAWLTADGARVPDPRTLLGPDPDALFEVDDAAVPFQLLPDGRWGGRWTPRGPEGEVGARFRVRAAAVDLVATATTLVEGRLLPVVVPAPATLDLGAWESDWRSTSRCGEIDLSGSFRSEQLDLVCSPTAPSGEVTLICGPAPGQDTSGPVLRWEACAWAAPCCDDAPQPDDPPLELAFIQQTEAGGEVLARVPVTFAVRSPGFLRCRAPGLIAAGLTAALILGALGLGRGRRFASDLVLRVASSEPALRRAAPLALSRLAAAQHPFLARRVAFDAEGNPALHEADAALVLEPGPDRGARVARGERLERRLPGSTGWAAVDETERIAGLQPGEIYRVGERLYFSLA